MLFTANYKILYRIICGAIAQLVERMDGIHEATGSSPVSSTSFQFLLFLLSRQIRVLAVHRTFCLCMSSSILEDQLTFVFVLPFGF
jgi:hypothetical protein